MQSLSCLRFDTFGKFSPFPIHRQLAGNEDKIPYLSGRRIVPRMIESVIVCKKFHKNYDLS